MPHSLISSERRSHLRWIFLVIQGENNLSHLGKVIDQGVHSEETVPDKENGFKERPELDCLEAACPIGIFA